MSNINDNKMYVSQETLEKYKKEYEHLVNVERPAVQAALKEARAQGDLSENAEYDAAREKQAQIEGRISELEKYIDQAVIIKNDASGAVGIGSRVKFVNLETKEEMEVVIMGSHDSNPFEGKISNKSPLAVAMLGLKPGEQAEVEAPKKFTIKILDVYSL
ncbi:transcription elongation factor GreA [Mycoplasmopsis gallopavonis]|uniref:Transcription elongation factor GreA n=1 Tax=Mycoplasmopsis gallopavonis TaxID=76629 RepID=A0A449AZC0_9BACT|nr:transcription elongation factor GreA [Mycoplasmopsis gallopavonis]RIV16439.1 transcription elongation factor GreA [Mycoplasmopsis gallopavonis]VEU72834.1 transcription elongation factor GreA [Mycoplasmopsis gallopavonis]